MQLLTQQGKKERRVTNYTRPSSAKRFKLIERQVTSLILDDKRLLLFLGPSHVSVSDENKEISYISIEIEIHIRTASNITNTFLFINYLI